eukprot:12401377-Karenia_brevis.AAC.1
MTGVVSLGAGTFLEAVVNDVAQGRTLTGFFQVLSAHPGEHYGDVVAVSLIRGADAVSQQALQGAFPPTMPGAAILSALHLCDSETS